MDTKDKARGTSAPPKRKKPKELPKPLQDVVYIPPKPFMRNRLLIRLASVAAIVVALVLAMSVFFRVENIQVSGMEQYSAWDISQASGIVQGESLFSLGMPAAAAKIQQALPYVKNVRIGIRLPNTVMIEITEVRVTYGVKAQDESWWLVDSGGRVVERVSSTDETEYTKILGVHLMNPQVGEQGVALETANTGGDTSTPVTVTNAQRLSVALDIADYLEANGIIGQAASIDVNDLGNLQFWYGQQYQVKLGDDSQLGYKINLVKGAIDGLSRESHNSGVLDATLTVDKTGVVYTRFQ